MREVAAVGAAVSVFAAAAFALVSLSRSHCSSSMAWLVSVVRRSAAEIVASVLYMVLRNRRFFVLVCFKIYTFSLFLIN